MRMRTRIFGSSDLKAMNRAIKNHVAEHKQADYGLVQNRWRSFLTEQILTYTPLPTSSTSGKIVDLLRLGGSLSPMSRRACSNSNFWVPAVGLPSSA